MVGSAVSIVVCRPKLPGITASSSNAVIGIFVGPGDSAYCTNTLDLRFRSEKGTKDTRYGNIHTGN